MPPARFSISGLPISPRTRLCCGIADGSASGHPAQPTNSERCEEQKRVINQRGPASQSLGGTDAWPFRQELAGRALSRKGEFEPWTTNECEPMHDGSFF